MQVNDNYTSYEQNTSYQKKVASNNAEVFANYQQIIAERIEELKEKIEGGDDETSYQIGAQSFTEKEWDKLMNKIDAIQDSLREDMRLRHEERVEKKEYDEKLMESALREALYEKMQLEKLMSL